MYTKHEIGYYWIQVGRAAWEACSGNLESWEPSQHLLIDTGEPCVEVAGKDITRLRAHNKDFSIILIHVRRIFFIFIITTKFTINIIAVYITTMYNLHSYMFRHFHVTIRDYNICASPWYTSFPNCSSWNYFIKSRCLTSSYISSWIMAV